MSASPDDPDFLQKLMSGINNGLSSPMGLLAMSLMGASGPSRMPVSTGQALAQGYAGATGLTGQVQQNKAQQIQLARTQAYLDALRKGMPTDQPQADQSIQQNPLMLTPSTPTPTSVALDALSSGKATPDQAMQISRTPLSQPPGSQAASQLGIPPGDPALNDQELQRNLYLSDAAPDAQTQTAWLTRARLRYDMLAGTPQYKAAVAGAQAQATLPEDAIKSILSQAGRGVSINPGAGDIVTSGLSLANPDAIKGLMQSFGLSMPGQNPAPFGGNPLLGGGNVVSTAQPPQSTDMGGVGTSSIPLPKGSIDTRGAVYQTNLAKDMAQADTQHVSDLWTDAKTASEGQQQLATMWQARNQGIYTGAGAAISGDIAKWADAAGVPLSQATKDQLASTQDFNKGAANLGVAVAKSLSSRPSQFEFKYLSGNAIANPQMQDTAIPLVMAQMGSVFQWKQMKAQYVDQQMRNGVNVRQAESNFDNYGSATPYALAILRQQDPASANKVLNYLKANNPTMYAKLGRETQWLQKNGLMPSTQDLMEGGY